MQRYFFVGVLLYIKGLLADRYCDNPLGLESGTLGDDKIKASSYISSIKMPKHARLQQNSAWTAKHTDNQYIQVDLSDINQITQIATQGRPYQNEYATLYKVSYSTNGIDWIYYRDDDGTHKAFRGNYDSDTIVKNQFDPPIISRFIRILPVQWHQYISMRLELYGCKYESHVMSFSGHGDLIMQNLTFDQSHRYNNLIKFRFLTAFPNGIIMHSIGTQGDILLIRLKMGKLFLYLSFGGYDTESGNILTVGSLLDDNHWHDVFIQIDGRNVTLVVDQMRTNNLLKNDYKILDLDTYISYGGLLKTDNPFTSYYENDGHQPTYKSPFVSLNSNYDEFRGFTGCLDNIMFNERNIVFEIKSRTPGLQVIKQPSYECKVIKPSILTFVLPETYFEWEALEGISALNVTMEFRTFHGNGLLMHHFLTSGPSSTNGQSNSNPAAATSYISLLLKDGKIIADISVPPSWENNPQHDSDRNYPSYTAFDESTYKQLIDPFDYRKWDDGLWHRVMIYIKSNEILLNVDDSKSVTRRKIDIKTGRTYFIAGGTTPDEYPGYLGCLRGLYLDSRTIPLALLTKNDFKSNSQGVIINSCSLFDRCNPNPCVHGGICTQDWNDFQCHCQGTGYSGAVCHSSPHPPSCQAYKERRHLYSSSNQRSYLNSDQKDLSKSSIEDIDMGGGRGGGSFSSLTGTPLIIDIDGSGPAKPFRVICEYDSEPNTQSSNYIIPTGTPTTATKTILGHNQQWDKREVPRASNDKSHKPLLQHLIHYDGLGRDLYLLELFVNRSTHCQQYLKYQCLRAPLLNSPNWDSPNVWMISRNNQPLYYWAGAPANSGKCNCGVKGTCLDKDKYCNCDSNKDYMTEDSGYLTEKQLLPITGFTFKDFLINDNQLAYYSIGPLVCSGDTLFQNTVTFRKPKAILSYAPIHITDAGDLQFEFKTSHASGIFFENLGSDGTRNYLRIKYIDGKKIQLEFNTGDGHRILSADSTDSLNDNKWHLVTLDWNRKELKLSVDSYRPAIVGENEVNFRDLRLTRKLVVGAKSDMTDGYVGCMRMFMINGYPIDLVTKVRNINRLLNNEIIDEFDNDLNQLNNHPNKSRDHKYNRKNIGIIEGCHGFCDEQTSFPCLNNGTCYEMWSHAKCDCAWTAFRGPYCTEDVGAHLKSDSLITYRFPSNLGSLTTISEHLRVAFSTLEFQGILLEITSYSGDFISLQLQNNGGLKIRFNFGYEPQEINDDRQVYANGQFHEVNLWRRDAGSTIVLQVDNYEPLTKKYETGFSQDTKFNDLRAIYIGRNESTPMGKGFIGCISRVEFEDYFPLKEVFGDPRPSHVSITNKDSRDLVEDMCNVIPQNPLPVSVEDVHDEILLKAENIEKVFNGFARRTPRYIGVKVTLIIASLIFITLISFFLAFLWAKYYTRYKGDYLTHEDDGAKDSIDADTAIMKSPIGQLDTIKKEWYF